MKRFTDIVSDHLDRIAGFTLVGIMALITANVIMRLLGYPIRGTVEMVGFLSAIAIGMSLAHCASTGGHIAVTLFADRLPTKVQAHLQLLVDAVVLTFLGFTIVRLCVYAQTLRATGQVSLTTGIHFYPFVLVIAFGFLVYALVVLSGMIDSIRKGGKR